MRPQKGFGTVDITKFRIPLRHTLSPHSTRRRQRTPSYSDGFEGREAEPIGRWMPVRLPNRRRETYHKITIKMGELTIVAEKPFEEDSRHRQQHHRKKRGPHIDKQARGVLTNDSNPQVQNGIELMLVNNNQPEQGRQPIRAQSNDTVFVEDQDRRTPNANDASMSEAPTSMGSPLKRKQQVTSANLVLNHQGDSSQLKIARRVFQPGLSQEQGLSQKLAVASAETKARKKIQRDVEIAQELMLVTLKRGLIESKLINEESEKEDNSELDSADGSYAESHSEVNEDEEDADDENSTSAEEDSGLDDEVEDESDFEEQESKSHLVTERPLDENGYMNTDEACDTETDAKENKTSSVNIMVRKQYPAAVPGAPGPRSAIALQQVASQALELGPQSSSLALPRGSNDFAAEQERPTIGNGRAVVNQILERSDVRHPTQQRRYKSIPNYSPNPDSSWRPRIPEDSGMSMEAEEEIVDTGSQIRVHTPARTTSRRRYSSRRHSRTGSQSLTIVRSRPYNPPHNPLFNNLQDSQGYVIFGEPTRTVRRPSVNSIPETQVVEDSEISEARLTFVPGASGYFERARRGLAEPTLEPLPLTRTRSMPLHMNPLHSLNPLMAPSSPVRAMSRLPTLLKETPDQMKSLKALTRQASLGLGTMPGSARKRMVSLPFTPPFKK
jgi:hypothetical protein